MHRKNTLKSIGKTLMIKKCIFIILILQGCAYASKDIYIIVKNQISGFSTSSVDVEDINNSKYSFMLVKLGRGPEIKMILNSYKDGLYEWISAEGERIFTFNGLIVKTENLEHNIDIKEFNKFSFSKNKQSFKINFDNPELVNADISYHIKQADKSRDSNVYGLLDGYVLTKQMSSIGWRFSDKYWVSSEGEVVESSQRFHPFYQTIHYRIFLKY